jgi:hypothetical protein
LFIPYASAQTGDGWDDPGDGWDGDLPTATPSPIPTATHNPTIYNLKTSSLAAIVMASTLPYIIVASIIFLCLKNGQEINAPAIIGMVAVAIAINISLVVAAITLGGFFSAF